jgi:heptosyltransferase-2
MQPFPAFQAGGAPPAAEPGAIVVRTPNWLGDLVVSTGFLSALLERFPRARVDLIVRRGFERLPLPHRGEVLPFDKAAQGAGAFGRALRQRGYSHMFVLPPSFSSAWMAFCAGVPHRIGQRGLGRTWLLRPALRPRHRPRSVHLLAEYLELLAPWMEARPEQYPPRLAATPEWIAAHLPPAAAALPPPVVLAPGAEYGPAKQWPAAHYRALALALAQAGWPCVVAGLPQDRPLGGEILAGLAGGVNLCGQTTLPQLVALLARAALVVSNDSGAMHVAAALGRPQIALFGSTNPGWTGPLNPGARVLYRAEPCSPCYARTCRFGHTRCLAELRPEGVTQQALALLGAAPAAPVHG